jgi:hypothetical protein
MLSTEYLTRVFESTIDMVVAQYVSCLSIFLFQPSISTFAKTVLNAYRWLSDNYKTGDKIYLFGEMNITWEGNHSHSHSGFSRGAYQVRTLAGMIEKVNATHVGNPCCKLSPSKGGAHPQRK